MKLARQVKIWNWSLYLFFALCIRNSIRLFASSDRKKTGHSSGTLCVGSDIFPACRAISSSPRLDRTSFEGKPARTRRAFSAPWGFHPRAAPVVSSRPRDPRPASVAPSSSQVRTPAFQAGDTGSNPVGATNHLDFGCIGRACRHRALSKARARRGKRLETRVPLPSPPTQAGERQQRGRGARGVGGLPALVNPPRPGTGPRTGARDRSTTCGVRTRPRPPARRSPRPCTCGSTPSG